MFEAIVSDLPDVLNKIEDLLTELDGSPSEVDREELLPFVRERLQSDEYTVLVAKDKGRIIGVLTLSPTTAVYAGGRFGVIQEFYIVPKHRSGGVGKQMPDQAKRFCHARDWKRLEVGAPAYSEWQRTKAFYVREGFAEVGPRLRWIAEQPLAL